MGDFQAPTDLVDHGPLMSLVGLRTQEPRGDGSRRDNLTF